jgi:hypothetical protein
VLNFSVWVYFLHLLRNATPAYYGLIFLVSSLLLWRTSRTSNQALYVGIFIVLLVLVYVSILSFTSPFSVNPITGLFRLFLLSPLILYVFTVRITEREEINFWRIVVVFSVLASLSLVFQLIVGPIPWFAESSFGRAGVERFSSLAGSLTAYGSLLPVSIIAAVVILKHPLSKLLAITTLLVGGFISLQKMALLTAFLALLVVAIRSMHNLSLRKSVFLRASAYLSLVFLVLFALYSCFADQPYFLYFSSLLDPSQAVLGDVSIGESVSSRFADLPFAAISFWGGIEKAWLGVGVMGASGGLGFPDFPMAHNLVVETVLVFGLPLSIIFLVYLCYLALRAVVNTVTPSRPLVFVSSASFLLLLFPAIFTGGLFYHPVSGLIFWFCCSRIVNGMKFRDFDSSSSIVTT